MLEKIKKYKLILILLFFILLLLINTQVNGSTVTSLIPDSVIDSIYNIDGFDKKSMEFIVVYNSGSKTYWLKTFNKNSSNTYYVRFGSGNYYFYTTNNVSWKNYRYNGSSWTYTGSGSTSAKADLEACTGNYFSSSFDIYDSSGNLFFEGKKYSLPPFHLEYNENTKSYFVYTDYMDFKTFSTGVSAYFNINGFQTAFSFDSYENYGWKLMAFESSSYDNEDGTNDWRYYQEIFEYGEYYFCLRNHDTETHNIYCIKITGDSSTISQYNENYTGSSDIFIELEHKNYEYKDYLSNDNQNFYINYIDNIANVYSNYFKEDDSYYYDCLYSKDYVNYSNDITTEFYDGVNTNYSNYYRFYKEIYENGTYYFRLRKIDKNTGSIISSNIYTVVVDGIVVNSVGENDTIEFYKNTNTISYFRKTLGIVFYPIDMMFNFFERLENLSSQEPSITVSDIKEPFSRTSFY